MNDLYFINKGILILLSMNSLSVAVVGPYHSGKTSLVNKLQQKSGAEGDVSFFSFKYSGRNITLIDTPGDTDSPLLMSSVLSVADAAIFCISSDTGITFQTGEIVVLMDTLKVGKGIICITKTDMSTEQEIENLKGKLKSLIKGTSMESLEMLEMNIYDDKNIADMRAKLCLLPYDTSLSTRPFKFAVDRAFESKGMSVAIGSIIAGKVSIHSDVVLTPEPFTKEVNVNGIQINQEDVQSAEAGDRAGISIKGVWPWDLPRGTELRQPGTYRDVKNGKLQIKMAKLYKQEIVDDTRLNLICNWQNCAIVLTNIRRGGEKLTADFESDKNLVFDKYDKMVVVNKELPIRMLRVVGSVEIL